VPRRILAAAAFTIALAGCAGYQLGHQSLYRPDIQTVHVPMFQSDDLRRHLAEWLTEAVVKEIEQRTPYRVVGSPDLADSVLTGRIVRVQKRTLSENRFDDPRHLELDLIVEVTWLDRRGDYLFRTVCLPIAFSPLEVGQPSTFIPEAGQSMATAQQDAIRGLARQIVGQMELPGL
jgi:hypothetical protein